MASEDYYWSIDVLDSDLAQEVYERLGLSRKVSFARSDRPYTKTENLLTEDLVDRCREALDDQDITENRVVLFGPFKTQLRLPGNSEKQAHALADRGFSLLVIADALGYSYQTLRRWDIQAGRQQFQPRGTAEELASWKELGLARVKEVHPDDARNPKAKHYLLVGAALAWLNQVV